jgi:hypothetical protein
LARLLGSLVGNFVLPLACIKPIGIQDMSGSVMLFMATFFMSLFTLKITDEDFQRIFDRVATTKDFASVRESVLFFLQKHFANVPSGLEAAEHELIKRRRKIALKTMQMMEVLTYIQDDSGFVDGDVGDD